MLSAAQVLAWCDDFHARTGRWPITTDGPVAEGRRETWMAIDGALRRGRRVAEGDSLARLLQRERGVPNRRNRPPLTVDSILAWADAHYGRTGRWPRIQSGAIRDAHGETWGGVSMALWGGRRGLPGGSSLARLLAEKRGAPYARDDARSAPDPRRRRTNRTTLAR